MFISFKKEGLISISLSAEYAMRNTLTRWMGIRVVVFQNDGIPDIYGKGIKVQPGSETNIALIRNDMTHLPAPYKSNCTDDWDPGFEYEWQPYSYFNCLESVQQLAWMDHCKCFVMHGMLNGLVERVYSFYLFFLFTNIFLS